MELEPNQLVLAKLRGHPWWPGIVSSNQVRGFESSGARARVDFIGENTQYRLGSAFLPEDKIEPYHRWKELCTTKQKSLLRALELARGFDNGLYQPSQLEEINTNPELGRARKRNRSSSSSSSSEPEQRPRKLSSEPEHRNRKLSTEPETRHHKLSSEPSLTALSEELDSKLRDYLTNSSAPGTSSSIAHVRKAQKAISGFTHVHSPDADFGKDVSKADLKQFFQQLVQLDMTPTVLRSCNVLKAVKLFSEEFIGHEDEELNSLGCMAHKLQLFWKKLKVTEDLAALSAAAEDQGSAILSTPVVPLDNLDVADLDLKKRSWKKLVRTLESKMDQKTARAMATLLERSQRKKDPSMRSDYHRLINNAVKELAKADAASVERAIQRLV